MWRRSAKLIGSIWLRGWQKLLVTSQLDRAPTVADLTPVYEQYAAANGVDISGIKSSGSARLLDIYGG